MIHYRIHMPSEATFENSNHGHIHTSDEYANSDTLSHAYALTSAFSVAANTTSRTSSALSICSSSPSSQSGSPSSSVAGRSHRRVRCRIRPAPIQHTQFPGQSTSIYAHGRRPRRARNAAVPQRLYNMYVRRYLVFILARHGFSLEHSALLTLGDLRTCSEGP